MYLCHCVFHDFLVGHIGLVANQQFVDTFGRIAIDLLQPLFDVVERIHICHIVDDADPMGSSVVGRSNSAEAFLAGGIPLKSKLVRAPTSYKGRSIRFVA